MRTIKRVLLCSCALLAVCLSAHAADLPAKAAAATPQGYPAITANGVYVGVGTFAEMTSSSISTGAISTNLNSVGGALEASIGYQYKIPGNNFAFTEASVNYTNLGGSTTCNVTGTVVTSCSTKSPWGFGIEQAFGFNWTYPLSFIPAFSNLFGGGNPSGLIPSGVTPVSSVPYISVRADIDNVQAAIGTANNSAWQVSPELRLGLINYLPQGGGVLKTFIGYEFGDAALSIGTKGGSATTGNTLKAGLSYAF